MSHNVVFLLVVSWMLFPIWTRRTFSTIIRYLPSGLSTESNGRPICLWPPVSGEVYLRTTDQKLRLYYG